MRPTLVLAGRGGTPGAPRLESSSTLQRISRAKLERRRRRQLLTDYANFTCGGGAGVAVLADSCGRSGAMLWRWSCRRPVPEPSARTAATARCPLQASDRSAQTTTATTTTTPVGADSLDAALHRHAVRRSLIPASDVDEAAALLGAGDAELLPSWAVEMDWHRHRLADVLAVLAERIAGHEFCSDNGDAAHAGPSQGILSSYIMSCAELAVMLTVRQKSQSQVEEVGVFAGEGDEPREDVPMSAAQVASLIEWCAAPLRSAPAPPVDHAAAVETARYALGTLEWLLRLAQYAVDHGVLSDLDGSERRVEGVCFEVASTVVAQLWQMRAKMAGEPLPVVAEPLQLLLVSSQRESADRAAELYEQVSRWNAAEGAAVSVKATLVLLWLYAQHSMAPEALALAREVPRAAEVPHLSWDTPRGVADVTNVLVALALVNAKLPHGGGTAAAPERLLGLLVRLGVCPTRPLAPNEFATLFRTEFPPPDAAGDAAPRRLCHATELLSPACVWRSTSGHPEHIRHTLAMMCFQHIESRGMGGALTLEDLYVLLLIARRMRRRDHERWRADMPLSPVAEGLRLPRFLRPATRLGGPTAVAYLVTLADAFVASWNTSAPVHMRVGGIPSAMTVSASGMPCATINGGPRLLSKTRPSPLLLATVAEELLWSLRAAACDDNVLATVWPAVLCAAQAHQQAHGAVHAEVASYASHVISALLRQLSEHPGCSPCGATAATNLVRAVVSLAPYASALSANAIVRHPAVSQRLTWQECLLLLPLVPAASQSRCFLLRRVALAQPAVAVPLLSGTEGAFIPKGRLWHMNSPMTCEFQILSVLREASWECALRAYQQASPRAQRASARHVVRLTLRAGILNADAPSNGPGDGVEVSRLLQYSLAASSDDGRRDVAEMVLREALRLGQWHWGLRFHQYLAGHQPAVVTSSGQIALYASALCRGLLQRSHLARVVAEVTRCTRLARWEAASTAFAQWQATGSRPTSHGESTAAVRCADVFSDWHVPRELHHLVHAVRYAMCAAPGSFGWRAALARLPLTAVALPLEHEELIAMQQRVEGGGTTVSTSRDDSEGVGHDRVATDRTELPVPVDLDVSLVQIALRERRRRVDGAVAGAGLEDRVLNALGALSASGRWEQAFSVFREAVARRCVSHSAVPVVLSACARGGTWEATLVCFAHLAARMRPDVATSLGALEACLQGGQWLMACRILLHNALTQLTPAPQLVDLTVRTAWRSGARATALRLVDVYRRVTYTPSYGRTVMHVYVHSQRWNDAVEYFYEAVVRGVAPHDEVLELAIVASGAASDEYRNMAVMVGAIATALEDLFHATGAVLEHVQCVVRIVIHEQSAASLGAAAVVRMHVGCTTAAGPRWPRGPCSTCDEALPCRHVSPTTTPLVPVPRVPASAKFQRIQSHGAVVPVSAMAPSALFPSTVSFY